VLEVIRRERVMACGKRGAARIGELVGVQPDRQAVALCRSEDARRLLWAEGDGLAEGIDRIGEPAPCDFGQHLLADEVEVGPAVGGELGRERVRAEEAGYDVDARVLPQGARHLQHPDLGRKVEPVARLDLDRGHALGQEAPQPASRHRLELARRGRPRRPHRSGDAAAAARDLLVGRAQQALLELVRPVAREHEMRMRVDQAGRDPAASDVDDVFCLVLRQLRRGAKPGDAPALDGERRLPDRTIGRAGFGHGGEVGVDEQAVEGSGHQ
jgi:hypothetical protein